MSRHVWTLFLCLLMLGGALFTYQIKYQSEMAVDTADGLLSDIDLLEEDISRLKAQWSLLNQPSRLQALVESNSDVLPLQPINAHQVVMAENIPEKSSLALVMPPRKPFFRRYQGDDVATLINLKSEPSLTDLINQEVR